MVKFLFSVHTITETKQSNRQGASQGSGSSSQVIRPGAPWCVAATEFHCGDANHRSRRRRQVISNYSTGWVVFSE